MSHADVSSSPPSASRTPASVSPPDPTSSDPTSGEPWTLTGFGDEIDADPVVQASVLAALGARHLEVRSAWGVNVVDLEPEALERLAAVLERRGVAVSAVASPIGKVDVAAPVADELARLEAAIRAAEALGTRYVRVFSFYRTPGQSAASIRDQVLSHLGALAARAEAAGIVLLHENEKDIYGDVPERVLDLVTAVGSAHLQLVWDAANFVQCGVVQPFTTAYAVLRPHLVYLHVKDALGGTGEVVPAGEGDGQLPETLAALHADGWHGFASLEPHLAQAGQLGGFSGPAEFGRAARAFSQLTTDLGVILR